MGARDSEILLRHILPLVIVEMLLSLTFIILAAAALSFFELSIWLQLGLEPDAIRDPRFFQPAGLDGHFPGLANRLMVMGFNFLSGGLRDAIVPLKDAQ